MNLLESIQMFFDQISFSIERRIWKLRKAVIPILLSILVIFISFKYASVVLAAFYDLTNNQGQTNEFSLLVKFLGLVALGLGAVIFEVATRYLNKISKTKKRSGTATFVDRIVSVLPYFWLWLETTRSYQFHLIKHFRNSPQLLSVVIPMLQSYENLPGKRFGLPAYIIFYILFFGIGRNRGQFKYVVRYHAIQAMLTDALFYFQFHLFSVWAERKVSDDFTVENTVVMFYTFIMLIIIVFAITAVLGIPTRIPFLHEAIEYHIGEEKDDPFNKS